MICSLLGCSLSSRSSQTIIVSQDSEISVTKYWVVKSVVSGDRLIVKKNISETNTTTLWSE